MVNDIIADSLTRLRNASMRRLEFTQLYYAKIVVSILEIFKEKVSLKISMSKIKTRNNRFMCNWLMMKKGIQKLAK